MICVGHSYIASQGGLQQCAALYCCCFLGGTESESDLVVLVIIGIVFKVVEENRVGLEGSVENLLSS